MLWLLLFLLSAEFSAGPDAWALADNLGRSYVRQLRFIISKHPAYQWGGSENPAKGLDCSGYLFLAAKWAAVPGVTRTTAFRMSMGMGGWTSCKVHPPLLKQCDLVFWTFSPTRPNGHVGALLMDADGRIQVTHSSSSRGVVVEKFQGASSINVSAIRRLTAGD
jgi:hypothetical protein